METADCRTLDFAASTDDLVGDVPAAGAVRDDEPKLLQDAERVAGVILRNRRVQMLAETGDIACVLRNADEGAESGASPAAKVGEFRFRKHTRFKGTEFQELVVKLGERLFRLGLVEPVKGLEILCPSIVEAANSDEHGQGALVQVAFFLENSNKPGRVHAGFLAEIAVRGERVVFLGLDKPVLKVLAIFQVI